MRSLSKSIHDLHVTLVFGICFSATFSRRCVATFGQKSGPTFTYPEDMKYVVANGYSNDDDRGMVYGYGDRALALFAGN